MLPIPKHLKNLLELTGTENNEFVVNGILKCTCGHKSFKVKRACWYKEKYTLVVKVFCNECGNEYLILDASKHGSGGFIGHFNKSASDDELNNCICGKCNENVFALDLCIASNGREEFIEEVVEDVEFFNGEFVEEDWVEAFDWFIINLKCANCGEYYERFVDFDAGL